MNGQPRIAFCTTVKNRAQHIEKTLPRNLASNSDYDNLVHIILNYNSTDHLLNYLVTKHKPDIKSGRLVVYSSPVDGPFAMAPAKNMASRCGLLEGADILVNVDADNFTSYHDGQSGPGFASSVANQYRDHGPDIFLWARVIKGQGRQFRGCSGRIGVTSTQFLIAGGYNEIYKTYSPDDKDFNRRLQRLGYVPVEINGRYFRSVPHNDEVRFQEYPHIATTFEAYDADLETDTSTVVNNGLVGCGEVLRNFDPNPIALDPIPTRIFGIGLHKTATNSLHKALTLLGYDSAHWTSGDWAKRIWDEMRFAGRSITLEKHYALSDLPVSILYRELDTAYPGSKFILTIRDEDKWIDSVSNHWRYDTNPYRWEWDVYPFSNQIHRELYGQKNFSEEVFRARYRQHNAEVKARFHSRPNDLLVMDMDSGHGWPELCGFLNRTAPSIGFPVEYVTNGGK